MNATRVNSTYTDTTKAVDGYGGSPTRPLTAARHAFDDPTVRVYHFCKPNDKTMMAWQLYDSSSSLQMPLIGVENVVDSKTCKPLPDREKPNRHYHK